MANGLSLPPWEVFMEVLDFTRKSKEYSAERLFFVYGSESYLIDIACKQITANAGIELPELNHTKLESDAAADEIIDNALRAPMFSEKRLVHIKNRELFADGKSAALKELCDLLGDIPETTVLLFSFHGSDDQKILDRTQMPLQKLDKRKSLYKTLTEKAFIITANPLSEAMLRTWILSTAKKKGLILNNQTVDFLSYICAPDMYSIMNELDKLASLGIPEPSADDILSICSHTTEYSIFLFHDYMIAKNYEKAFDLLQTIYTEEKSFIGLTASLSNKFRLMYMAKSSLNLGYSAQTAADQLSKKAGIKAYPARLAVQECRGFTLENLKRSFKLLLDYDISQKSSTTPEDFRIFSLKLYTGI